LTDDFRVEYLQAEEKDFGVKNTWRQNQQEEGQNRLWGEEDPLHPKCGRAAQPRRRDGSLGGEKKMWG